MPILSPVSQKWYPYASSTAAVRLANVQNAPHTSEPATLLCLSNNLFHDPLNLAETKSCCKSLHRYFSLSNRIRHPSRHDLISQNHLKLLKRTPVGSFSNPKRSSIELLHLLYRCKPTGWPAQRSCPVYPPRGPHSACRQVGKSHTAAARI